MYHINTSYCLLHGFRSDSRKGNHFRVKKMNEWFSYLWMLEGARVRLGVTALVYLWLSSDKFSNFSLSSSTSDQELMMASGLLEVKWRIRFIVLGSISDRFNYQKVWNQHQEIRTCNYTRPGSCICINTALPQATITSPGRVNWGVFYPKVTILAALGP